MDRAKEEWMQSVSVLDRWQVWSNHLRIVLFSILLFFFYGAYLWIICSSSPNIFSGLLLFFSQVSIGVPASRAYYDLGVGNRAELKMFDSAVLGRRNAVKEVDLALGQVKLIFEHLLLDAARSVRTVLDDYTDMSWFLVLTWAVVSSVLYYFSLIPTGICLLGDVILAVACTASYLSGYWMNMDQSLEGDLDHLEYFALKRLKVLDSTIGTKVCILLLAARRARKLVLVDFAARLKPHEAVAVEYHMGLPLDESERFVVEASESQVEQSKERLRCSSLVQSGKWFVESVRTRSGFILRFVNKSDHADETNSRPYLGGLDLIEKSSQEFRTAIRDLMVSLE